MNAETEHRLSDEYQSQTEIEPVRPKDKVGIYKISQFVICYNFDAGQSSTRTKCEQSLAQHGKPGQHVAREGERVEARTSGAETSVEGQPWTAGVHVHGEPAGDQRASRRALQGGED